MDRNTGKHVWPETIALADKHSLTVYDATYLELALCLSLPLATLDADLRAAAPKGKRAAAGEVAPAAPCKSPTLCGWGFLRPTGGVRPTAGSQS
ncbi:MAG: type II toxin-antitoxin system VapC family toxin [Terracidiphilus sp.]|nr:type II toxin-antitoxin system VapC family toxin [Terracidiphilus sp.]